MFVGDRRCGISRDLQDDANQVARLRSLVHGIGAQLRARGQDRRVDDGAQPLALVGVGELIGQSDAARYRAARSGDQLSDAVHVRAVGLGGGDQHDLALGECVLNHARSHGGIEITCRVELFIQRVLVLIQILDLPLLAAFVLTQARQQRVVEQSGTEYDAHREGKKHRGKGYGVLAQGDHGCLS
ncbi:Uncharacterised protein [Mycobacteroides abscessus subsp. abscessus]|nr:Uncharacterised protein [Mycobacteroides abscessus subsp. abscessus]